MSCYKRNKKARIEIPLYGIVTTGLFWEFGKLEGNVFRYDLRGYSIVDNPTKVAGILNHIFTEAVQPLQPVVTIE